jgi:hypothetical protein
VTSWSLAALFLFCSSTAPGVAQAKFAGISHAQGRVRLAIEAGLPGSVGVTAAPQGFAEAPDPRRAPPNSGVVCTCGC